MKHFHSIFLLCVLLILLGATSHASQAIVVDNSIQFSDDPQMNISLSKKFRYINVRESTWFEITFYTTPMRLGFWQITKAQNHFPDHIFRTDDYDILIDVRKCNPSLKKDLTIKEYFEKFVEMGTIIKSGTTQIVETPFVFWTFVREIEGIKWFGHYLVYEKKYGEVLQIRILTGISPLDYDELLTLPSGAEEGKRFYGFFMEDINKLIKFSK